MIERVIKPVEYPKIRGPLLFLGGPIQGGPDWQKEAISIINSRISKDVDFTIANPRREYLGDDFDYDEQTDWERFHIERACQKGVVMFWFAKQTIFNEPDREYAQTSRVEIAEVAVDRSYNHKINLVVGMERNFSGARYIENKMLPERCPDLKVCKSLEETCQRAVEIILRS